jgi:DNA-binding response OmpR family regulator
MKVLIIEDDDDIVSLLRIYFESKGHEVEAATDGVEGLRKLQAETPQLIVLDIVLPRLDGWSVLEAIRARSKVPVILLTALDSTDDVVRGLALGADDYLCKPFQVRELDARMQAILRRVQGASDVSLLQVGAIRIDDRAKTVTVDRQAVALSPREYDLLKLLATDPGKVFSSEEIIAEVWAGSSRAAASDVKQYVHRLRVKIESRPDSPQRLETVKGFGYKLVV